MGEDRPARDAPPSRRASDLTARIRSAGVGARYPWPVDQSNVVRCPRCGQVRVETPPGTFALPTFGTALKNARGAAGTCECGQRHLDEDDRLVDETSA